jgi:hypothetical protein
LSGSYLVQRGRRYHLRLRIPADLLHLFGRRELHRSLRVTDARLARACPHAASASRRCLCHDPTSPRASLASNRDPSRQARFRTGGMEEDSDGEDSSIPAGAPRSFVRARTVRENYRALRERAEYQIMIGSLLNYREVEAAGESAGIAVRDRIMQAAPEVAAKIASDFKIDANAVETIIRSILKDALIRAGERLTREIQNIQKGNRYYEDAEHDLHGIWPALRTQGERRWLEAEILMFTFPPTSRWFQTRLGLLSGFLFRSTQCTFNLQGFNLNPSMSAKPGDRLLGE